MRISEEQLYQYAPMAEVQIMAAEYPSDDEVPKHKFSRKFEKKMGRHIKDQRRSPAMRRMVTMAKRVAIFVLITSTITFSCLMTVEAFREKVIAFVTEVFEDMTEFRFFSSAETTDDMGKLTLTYVPEGMEEIYSEESDAPPSRIIIFEDAEGSQLTIDQHSVGSRNNYTVALDTEDASVSKTEIKGEEATLVIKGEWSAAMWNDDQYVWLVYGEIPSDELLKVIDGISLKNN